MKEKKKLKFYTVLSLAAVVSLLSIWEQKSTNLNQFNFKKYKHIKENKPLSDLAIKVESNEKKTEISRSIAQRKPLPIKGQGRNSPSPLRIRPRSKTEVAYPESEFDLKMGGVILKHNLYAIKKDVDIPSDYKIIEQKLGHFIVETNQTPSQAMAIVKIEGSKDFAIFTGVLKIKFIDIEDSSELLSRYAGIINEDYSHINTILYQFDQFEETMLAYEELRQNPKIEYVDIELLQYQRSSK